MKVLHKIFVLVLLVLHSTVIFPQKKIYADYHGVRRTRVIDGDFGEWKYFSQLTNNPTGLKHVTYNPDLILENGQHDIASANYPIVGMQSQLDPDYIEYQILSAKSAGIDGFFVEWGYMAHSSHELLQSIQQVALKYNFEVGVNLVDGWLMNKNWYPGTRAEKLQYALSNMQYLIDNIFSGPTAPLVNGKPVFYLFHDGYTEAEFSTIRNHSYTYPESYPIASGNKFPDVIMRTTLGPSLVNGVYTPKNPVTQAGGWVNNNRVVPTSWIPERIRSAGSLYPGFTRYASADDCVKFIAAFKTNVWDMGYSPSSGLVAPGMDNYGCAGWSPTGTLYIIPREDGDTYRQMWNYNLQNKNVLDMVYITSWSDFTEGHEIEPTVENGFRELNTTLEYASQFKGESSYDISGIEQSYELFLLRKKNQFFKDCGINTENYQNLLDGIAHNISNKNYSLAETQILQVKADFTETDANIQSESYVLQESDLDIYGNKNEQNEYVLSGSRTSITILDSDLKNKLKTKNYEGYLIYEYWDDTWGRNTNIVSGTDRQPYDLFKFIGQIKDKGLQQWVPAKIRLYKENIKYGEQANNSDISFYGDGSLSSKIRNIRLEYTVYTPEEANSTSNLLEDKLQLNCSVENGILKIKIENQDENHAQLIVRNLNGVQIYSSNILDQQTDIDVSTWTQGVYLLSVHTARQSITSKFIR